MIGSNRASCTDDLSLWLAGRQAISDLSFSHDGEYLAIAGAGSYIDIVRSHLSYFCPWRSFKPFCLKTVHDGDGYANASCTCTG